MDRRYFYLLIFVSALFSCNTQRGLFSSSTPHESYGAKLSKAGLSHTKMATAWFTAANTALRNPSVVKIPFRETGFFPAEKPVSAAFLFNASQGELIVIDVKTTPLQGVTLFLELYEWNEGKPDLIFAADTVARRIEREIKKEGQYLVRMQSELLQSIGYTVEITTAPSLAFPVPQSANPKVSSLWGVDRDGGARRHEGIDIFAKKLTPALAASDGTVTRVTTNNLGGNVVFLRPDDKNISLYYAHLEEQKVTSGQRVKAGDVIGLIGNTGNARTTPPHLHFGIYTNNGAIDPYPFVNKNRPSPPSIKSNTSLLNNTARATKAITIEDDYLNTKTTIPANTVVHILSASTDRYKIILPDGATGYIRSSLISDSPVRSMKLSDSTVAYDEPDQFSAVRTIFQKGDAITVQGAFGKFLLVSSDDGGGWILPRS